MKVDENIDGNKYQIEIELKSVVKPYVKVFDALFFDFLVFDALGDCGMCFNDRWWKWYVDSLWYVDCWTIHQMIQIRMFDI